MLSQKIKAICSSLQNTEVHLHAFLQKYYKEKSNQQPGEKTIRIELPLKLAFHDPHDETFIFYFEATVSLSLNPQEIQALYLYSYKNKQVMQKAIVRILKELLKEQESVQAMIQKYKPKRQLVIQVELREEMGWHVTEQPEGDTIPHPHVVPVAQ